MLSLVGIAPHPPIILPEIGRGELKKVKMTVDGMKELAGRVRDAASELLIMITPHGEVSHQAPVILTAEKLRGDFARFGFPYLQLNFETDRKLLEILKEESSSETLQPLFVGDKRIALDHGAMVPLYYLAEAGVKAAGLHLTFGFNSYRELYNFGRVLRRAVDRRGVSTAVIASGDLSHRLIPGAPAGYSPRGEEFDLLLVDLIRHGQIEEILNIDQNLVEEAGECGLRSFVIALGMLDGQSFASDIISYEGPFGVGYLVAALQHQES
jgi:MEMO1 family protein